MASKRFVQDSHNSCTAGDDRISNLPSMLTERILECLPLYEVVKMSVLSRYWRNMWVLLPQLILDKDFFEVSLKRLNGNELDDFGTAYADIVNNVLYRHTGPILKFVLYLHPEFPISGDISHWVQLVFAKGVKEFTWLDHRDRPSKIPSCLFSSVIGLTHLTLYRCQIGSLPLTFSGFPCLTSLHLDCYHCTEAKSLYILISSCPQLESLNISIYDPSEFVFINAPKLRNLVVCGIFFCIHLKGATKLNTISLDIVLMKGMCNFWHCLRNIETLVISNIFWQTLHHKETSKITNKFGRLAALKVVGIPISCHRAISFVLSFTVTSPNLQQLEIELDFGGSFGQNSTIMHTMGDSCRTVSELISLSMYALSNVSMTCWIWLGVRVHDLYIRLYVFFLFGVGKENLTFRRHG